MGGVTFLIIFFDDNSYLYIYYQILFLPRPKVSFKKFYRCSFEPGVIFKNQKMSKIFISEATESCKGSKGECPAQLAHFQMDGMCISRVYTSHGFVASFCFILGDTCRHVKYTCKPPGNGLVVLGTPKNPHFDPLHDSVASETNILLSF